MKVFFLYLMAALYASAGVIHFIYPKFYLKIIPSWMPSHLALVYISGIVEILLAILLIVDKTRIFSAWTIILMLVVFLFVIHIPQTLAFYKIKHPMLLVTIIRLPLQFLLIAWAYYYTDISKFK